MALWLVRAGRHGEYEKKFLEENRIYLTWGGLSHNLASIKDREELRVLLKKVYPDAPKGRLSNHLGQIWAFSQDIAQNDWIVLPSKQKPAIHVAKVKGDYTFDHEGEDPFFHYREIEWITQDVPRTNFDQDLLYSFGAFMAICRLSRNGAEARVQKMAQSESKAPGVALGIPKKENGESTESSENLVDLAQFARDQLAKFIIAKFKGHGLARLVDAVYFVHGDTPRI